VPATEFVIDINPVLVQIGPLDLTATGLSVGVAVAVAILLTAGNLRRRGLAPAVVYDLVLFVVPAGLIGGRLFEIVDNWTYYGVHPIAVIAPGGFSLGGALLVGGVVGLRKLRRSGVAVEDLLDSLGPGVLVALVIGGIGPLASGGFLGRPTETFLAVKYINAYAVDQRGLYVYPVAVYWILWFAFGCGLGRLLRSVTLPSGTLGRFCVLWIGLGQLWLGAFRSEPADYFGLSQGQLLGVLLATLAIAWFSVDAARHKACSVPGHVAQPTR